MKDSNVEIEMLSLNDFISINRKNTCIKKISKKELKILAKELSLSYDKSHLNFTKKILNEYIKRQI